MQQGTPLNVEIQIAALVGPANRRTQVVSGIEFFDVARINQEIATVVRRPELEHGFGFVGCLLQIGERRERGVCELHDGIHLGLDVCDFLGLGLGQRCLGCLARRRQTLLAHDLPLQFQDLSLDLVSFLVSSRLETERVPPMKLLFLCNHIIYRRELGLLRLELLQDLLEIHCPETILVFDRIFHPSSPLRDCRLEAFYRIYLDFRCIGHTNQTDKNICLHGLAGSNHFQRNSIPHDGHQSFPSNRHGFLSQLSGRNRRRYHEIRVFGR
mmetsp:Transcript_9923/g.20757  ORF Transcript_9923/g.20757 Transcript_9923/m.20757 type:complete len:269 (-) Transcript_9923:1951-2757(-)